MFTVKIANIIGIVYLAVSALGSIAGGPHDNTLSLIAVSWFILAKLTEIHNNQKSD